jgi:hypothetical protein
MVTSEVLGGAIDLAMCRDGTAIVVPADNATVKMHLNLDNIFVTELW